MRRNDGGYVSNCTFLRMYTCIYIGSRGCILETSVRVWESLCSVLSHHKRSIACMVKQLWFQGGHDYGRHRETTLILVTILSKTLFGAVERGCGDVRGFLSGGRGGLNCWQGWYNMWNSMSLVWAFFVIFFFFYWFWTSRSGYNKYLSRDSNE